jgi:hypothetical protein
VLGVVALVTAFYTLFKYKMISLSNRSGKLYVLVTIVVAGSALGIYNQGGFGVAHWLAVLTLAAVSGGIIMEKLRLFGRFSIYFQALGYSSTLLFHMIPAITDFLRRLPLGDPFVDSFSDPLVVGFHKLFLLIFVVAMAVQLRWLSKRSSMDAVEAQD